MKKILGLDLGVTSIGWALISEDDEKKEIIGLGSRIIPLSIDDKDEFSSGNKISKNQKRTSRRTQRKGYDRYQQRRKLLTEFLLKNKMFDDKLFKLNPLELWGIRAKGVTEKISLTEFGRVLYHLNQKRGYKSSRSEANLDKKDTEYVAVVKNRYNEIKDLGITIGQKFYKELQKDEYYRIKEQVFPREAYIDEFQKICKNQQKYYPQITDELISLLKDEIIYFQRPLKSQKGLVSVCEFEKIKIEKNGREIFVGPKTAPKSSPLFQLCKIWEVVNNISLKVKSPIGAKYKWTERIPTIDEKNKIVEYLNENLNLSFNELLKILGLRKDEVYANKQILKGIQGNTTYTDISKVINDIKLLKFDYKISKSNHISLIVDKKTGEIINENDSIQIDATIEKEPLYQLWHVIYSINDLEECKNALIKRFNFDEQVADKLSKLDFTKQGFGNKSNKAIRKILPYLMQGFDYSQACSFAGYNHSSSLTKEEQESRRKADKLELLPKNSLRQPIVEKILNQKINVVNAIINKFGKPDEIRIELARELKQSKDERNDADKRNSDNKRLNAEIEFRLKELGLPATKKYIQKYKFIFPALSKNLKDAKTINQCIYCGGGFNLSDAINGDNFDVDHIVPRALLFDDSQTNKVLVHRSCNATKTNQTAYDFIAKKGELELNKYIERVDDWFNRGIISYSKMQRLKVSYEEYLVRKKNKKETESDKKLWESFIDRQLRESQYIARKSKELLQNICNNVTSTEGSVTAKLRELWGWDDVLMNLQMPKFKELEKTSEQKFIEIKEWTSENGRRKHQKEQIINWTKRDDHRHHAIDALVIACTKQGFIQRINTLSSSDVKDEMNKEIESSKVKFNDKLTLLEKYLVSNKPFNTSEVEEKASGILISFKSGKKVATKGVRKIKLNGKKQIIQKDIIVPRGPLSEESVYGKIKVLEKNKPLKYLFEKPYLIFKPYIKDKIEERLDKYENDVNKALKSLKKDPIYLNKEQAIVLEYATCYKEEYVIKYPLQSIKAKDVVSIIDNKIKNIVQKRLEQFNNKEKEAFKDVLYFNEEKKIPIKSVRMFTGLSAVEPVKKDDNGNEIGFVKPGNNHHIAIYTDIDGKKNEHICTFWHAVERKKYGLPVIIKNTNEIWDKISNENENKYPQSFLEKLPKANLELDFSMQQNEMFILGMNIEEANNAIEKNDYKTLSNYLYRVQKIGSSDYTFRNHLETIIISDVPSKISKRYFRIASISALKELNPLKIYLDVLGNIIHVNY